jgi:hypothetical protein
MTNLRPLAPTYVVASEDGHAMFEGVDVALVDETVELPDELCEETDVPEVCDVEDTVVELTVEEEALPVMSLAPQIAEALFAAPSVFFK